MVQMLQNFCPQQGNECVILFKVKQHFVLETISFFRYEKYNEMACRGSVLPEKLPPTHRAAYYHGLCVHYQIMCWSGKQMSLDPMEWGWRQSENMLVPIKTDLDVAPALLKTIIHCMCKVGPKGQCETNRCTCRKHGLPCLPSCRGCRGESCSNLNVSSILFYILMSKAVSLTSIFFQYRDVQT